MILFLDNFDSFTFMLVDYFKQLDIDVLVKRNDEISCDEIAQLQPQAIVLGPGPNQPKDSGVMMELIEKFHQSIPMLGICLGHQAIGEFFGAKLVRAEKPLHGKVSDIFHENHFMFENFSSPFEAMRYHSLILENIENTSLNIICKTATTDIMGIAHPKFNIIGLQFHPESILTKNGLQILKNWKHHFLS
jgi:anthranilate synthase/aminodeoxychorismate synthase-like glutamine amidotransferase